jgi:hypothetical protein
LTTAALDLRDFNPFTTRDLANVPDAVRNQMRHRALNETYYMAKTVLGYDKLTPSAHGPACTFLDTCKCKRRMLQMPRSHLKTTIGTITKRIQDVMRDPTLRILIIGDTDTNAEKHLAKIKRHFVSNSILRWLFPENIWEDPESQAPVWSRREIVLPNSAVHGESTFDAIGAGSGVVSRHYDIINPDDLISEEEYYSETEMQRMGEWVTGLESLFVPPTEEGLLDIFCTFWRADDAYARLEDFFAHGDEKVQTGPFSFRHGEMEVFRRGAIENGELIFPEGVSMKFLERLRETNPERYAAQYANNPYASDVAYFKKEYLRFYTWMMAGHIITFKNKAGDAEKVNIRDLEIMSFCDPAAGGSKRFGGSRGAVITTGTHPRAHRVFILDCWIKRAPTDRIISEIIRQNEKWSPQLFSIEANGLQKMIKPWLEERIVRERRIDVPYVPFIPKGDKDGERRIKGLQPLFRAGQILMQEGFHELIEEYLAWRPGPGKKDGLDCLSQGLEQWGITYDDVTDEDMWQYEERIRSMRSTATGY